MTELRFERIKSILFIHHMLAMGEVILLIPLFETVMQNLPDASLSIIAKRYACNFLRTLPYFKNVIDLESFGCYKEKTKLYRLIKPSSFLLKNRYDLIVWRGDRRFPHYRLMKTALFSHPFTPRLAFGPLLAKYVDENKHVLDVYKEVLKEIGFEIKGNFKPHLNITPEAKKWAERFLTEKKVDITKDKIIGICPKSNLSIKNWSKKHLKELIEVLLKKKFKVLLFTTEKLDFNENKVIPIGILPFDYLKAVIKHCHVFISVDTGPMHVASAVGVPVIAIFGPTSGKMFGPYGEKKAILQKHKTCPYYQPTSLLSPYLPPQRCYVEDKCLLKKTPCTDLITPKEVLNALEEFV
jgi:ADP-heptose:LPS heptosyltransferase